MQIYSNFQLLTLKQNKLFLREKRGWQILYYKNSSEMEHHKKNIVKRVFIVCSKKLNNLFLKLNMIQNNTSLKLSILNANLDKLTLCSLFPNLLRRSSQEDNIFKNLGSAHVTKLECPLMIRIHISFEGHSLPVVIFL